MQPVPVICSFSTNEKHYIKPIYFGVEDHGLQRIKIDRVLRVSKNIAHKDAYFAGMTLEYLDKMVFECEYTDCGIKKICTLIYDPQQLKWFLEQKK